MLLGDMDTLGKINPAVRAPAPRSDWALFLDIDGTLIDIAPRPDAVVVPADLPSIIEGASQRLGGALAVVSGRPIKIIDEFMAPLVLPCAAEHGAIVRTPDGTVLEAGEDMAVPRRWREQIRDALHKYKGVLLGEKSYGLDVHYRLAPHHANEIGELVKTVVAEDPSFEVLPAHMAREIRHKNLNKGAAVQCLMKYPPFAGRIPIFVGDDVTDEDGFRAAKAAGGLGLHVSDVFDGKPAEVRRWLKSFAVTEER